MTHPLLQLNDVSVDYAVRSGILNRRSKYVRAVKNVSLSIQPGETLGLVGESGCGKSTLGRAVLGLRPLSTGYVSFDGRDIASLNPLDMRRLRQDMQLVFQDPYSSLDPQATIGRSIAAGLAIHTQISKAERNARTAEIMAQVGLDPALANRFPHEFSGGMRQRVVIARALILKPKLVICDEPTSALDVSIQSQIINMLSDLKDTMALTYLFISHDLAVVEHIADRVAVMYQGEIVEIGTRSQVFDAPKHRYTQQLLQAVPISHPSLRRARG